MATKMPMQTSQARQNAEITAALFWYRTAKLVLAGAVTAVSGSALYCSASTGGFMRELSSSAICMQLAHVMRWHIVHVGTSAWRADHIAPALCNRAEQEPRAARVNMVAP